MVSFASVLKPEDVEAIRAYVITEAQAGYAAEHPTAAK